MNPKNDKSNPCETNSKSTCPLCNQDIAAVEFKQVEFDYGAGESMVQLAANVPVYRCEACDFEYLDYEAEQRKQEAVCRYLGVLTPGEIKQIRNGFAMTRAEFSKITGIGPASLNRWENGLSIQTLAYDRYLRLLGSLRNRRILEMFFVGVGFQNGVALENRFRAITVTECLKKEQSSFQLCKVA